MTSLCVIAECLSMRHIIVTGLAAGSLLLRSAYIYIYIYICPIVYGNLLRHASGMQYIVYAEYVSLLQG